MFNYLLYFCWFIVPISYFFIALYAKLEKISGSPKRQNPFDFLKQGIFVLVCALISLLIDRKFIADWHHSYLPDWIPLDFLRVILMPALLLLGAKIVGGSKPIRISKPGRISQPPKH